MVSISHRRLWPTRAHLGQCRSDLSYKAVLLAVSWIMIAANIVVINSGLKCGHCYFVTFLKRSRSGATPQDHEVLALSEAFLICPLVFSHSNCTRIASWECWSRLSNLLIIMLSIRYDVIHEVQRLFLSFIYCRYMAGSCQQQKIICAYLARQADYLREYLLLVRSRSCDLVA